MINKTDCVSSVNAFISNSLEHYVFKDVSLGIVKKTNKTLPRRYTCQKVLIIRKTDDNKIFTKNMFIQLKAISPSVTF